MKTATRGRQETVDHTHEEEVNGPVWGAAERSAQGGRTTRTDEGVTRSRARQTHRLRRVTD